MSSDVIVEAITSFAGFLSSMTIIVGVFYKWTWKPYVKKKEEREENENESEYLFSTERRPYRKMQNKTIQDAINKVAARTNIRKNVTPHVFRHTFATLAMENGIELGDLQQLLGHVNPATTIRYAEVSEERKRNAHKRFVK